MRRPEQTSAEAEHEQSRRWLQYFRTSNVRRELKKGNIPIRKQLGSDWTRSPSSPNSSKMSGWVRLRSGCYGVPSARHEIT